MHHGKHKDMILPDHFFTMPRTAHATMTTPELRSVLLRHDVSIHSFPL